VAPSFGSGDVYLGSGAVAIGSTQAVVVAGKYTQLQNATRELNVVPNGQGLLRVGGQTTLSGDLLNMISTGAYAQLKS
jgi:hypothetical protein